MLNFSMATILPESPPVEPGGGRTGFFTYRLFPLRSHREHCARRTGVIEDSPAPRGPQSLPSGKDGSNTVQ